MKNNWSQIQKIGFQFSFLFFGLYIFFEFFGRAIPFVNQFLHWIVPLFSKTFGVVPYDIVVFENGSGDTTYNWVLVLLILVLAVFGSSIWAIVFSKNTNYDRLNYWLIAALRFYVGFTLIEYGMIKVWKLQFPYPSPYRLMQTYGDSSPMALAWTFLGFSKGYNLFMGIVEILASLLFWRRTVTVGAIITLMTTANVMAINFFYDVPVKIISSTLFLMTLYILVFNIKDLLQFFFTDKPTTLSIQKAFRFSKKYLNISILVLKYAIVAFSLLGLPYFSYTTYIQDFKTPKHTLFGYYERMASIPNPSNDWVKLNFVYNDLIKTYKSSGITATYSVELDSVKKHIKLINVAIPDSSLKFNYKIQGDTLSLSQSNQKTPLIFLRKSTNNTRLMTRGFHWINETPYNF
ncbi:MAG TPA: hypothetical protein VK175_18755 [Leadbetterella sp.]|nr:hypothetical protein [Leadbetterella sp.]